jgi:hypothetical protein
MRDTLWLTPWLLAHLTDQPHPTTVPAQAAVCSALASPLPPLQVLVPSAGSWSCS